MGGSGGHPSTSSGRGHSSAQRRTHPAGCRSSSMTPPSKDRRPRLNVAVSFLPRTDGNQNGRVASSVMADMAGSMGWTGLAQQPKPTQHQLMRLHPSACQTGPREQEPDAQVNAALQCLAMRPVSMRMLAMIAKALALSMDFSQSFAMRRQRPSHANVRSMTGVEAGQRSPWSCLSA